MTYTTQRSDSNLPPSQRRKFNQIDYERRKQAAASYAASLNKQNRIAEKQEANKKSEALDLLQSGELPKEDILHYVAQSMGMSLEQYQRMKDEEFNRAYDQLSRQYQRKAHQEITERFNEEERRLIETYTKPATKKGKK